MTTAAPAGRGAHPPPVLLGHPSYSAIRPLGGQSTDRASQALEPAGGSDGLDRVRWWAHAPVEDPRPSTIGNG
ncbi:hypothetical protein [Frankia sp. ACN1ag]|uniref:hypothetical protein n=1 Tax=Frankia sp. ACN1ag TaxID=102891 RepID=UPI0006DC89B1|nr:hypothetical protein [Frankia sp. ACN1ag]KQC35986.1 hypothetical protein UK82_23430 [Frankia sp. ACN1ag]